MKLSKLNIHKRDKRIEFYAENHTYVIDKSKYDFISATTFIKKFFTPFDADSFIQNLIDTNTFYKRYPNNTPENLKKEWNDIGSNASKLGTLLHESIEYFYNEEHKESDITISKEWGLFTEFYQDHSHLIPYRTEWYVFTERFKIAGSIDMVFKDKEDKYYIYDWKRSKQIKFNNKYQNAKNPISHIEDCNYYHYSLQLNLYKYILKHCYHINIYGMYLVILHPNNETYKLIKISDLEFEIKQMLKYRFNVL